MENRAKKEGIIVNTEVVPAQPCKWRLYQLESESGERNETILVDLLLLSMLGTFAFLQDF